MPVPPPLLSTPLTITPSDASYPFSPHPFPIGSAIFAPPIDHRLALRPSPTRRPPNRRGSSQYGGKTPTTKHGDSSPHLRRQASSPSLPPPGRSLAELHAEQSYLQHNLGSQEARARRLMASLSSIPDRQAVSATPGEVRRLRKEAAMLRNKLDDAAMQERLTLLRLGDLHAEIRRRERWCQAFLSQRPAAPEQLSYSPLSGLVSSPSGWITSIDGMSPGVWSPISPMAPSPGMFQPSWPAAEGAWVEMSSGAVGEGELHASDAAEERDETAERETEAPKLESEFTAITKANDEVSSWQGRLAGLSLDPTYEPRPQDKRMSLPSLRFCWPESVGET